MATDAQINANRENAKKSTGPRSEAGRAASSRNRIVFGLFTHQDYVRPDECALYREFCESMNHDLNAEGTLEESCAAEIVAASWRLRRCAAAEFDIAWFEDDSARPYPHGDPGRTESCGRDPLTDEAKAKALRSIERARAAAQLALNRAHTMLRKLKKEREAMPKQPTNEDLAMQNLDQVLNSIMNCPAPSWDEIFPPETTPGPDQPGAPDTAPRTAAPAQSGLNCKPQSKLHMPPALHAFLAAKNSKLVGGTGIADPSGAAE